MSGGLLPTPDKVTGDMITIDHEHHEIHCGDSFVAHFEDGTPTNIGEETAIGFKTPAAADSLKRIHLVVNVLANKQSNFEIREAPTVVANQGTAMAPLNRDRDSANESLVINHQTPAVANSVTTYTVAQAAAANLAAAGAVLHSETIAIAGGPPFGSIDNALSRGRREFVLAPDTDYVVILTSETNDTTQHEIQLDFYEHAPSNYLR